MEGTHVSKLIRDLSIFLLVFDQFLMHRLLIVFSFCFCYAASDAQIRAKAISYSLEVDLAVLDPSFDEDDGGQRYYQFEVDAYYTPQKLRTVVRKVGKHADSGVTIRQRLYDLDSQDEYNIDSEQEYILFKKNQTVKAKATGKQKDILGFRCREIFFTDYRGVGISIWITDKLDKNICPLGNYSLKGTALEITTANGLHYVATDLAEGELRPDFFEIPQGYQQEVVLVSEPDKKSR